MGLEEDTCGKRRYYRRYRRYTYFHVAQPAQDTVGIAYAQLLLLLMALHS